jgi:hypothetical protein
LVDRLRQPLKDEFPESLSGLRGNERIGDDVVEASAGHPRLDVLVGLAPEDDAAAVQRRGQRLQAFEVEIGIDATKVMHPQIAHGVDPLDGLAIGIVNGQKGRVMIGDEAARGFVRPETILPIAVVAEPAGLQTAQRGRDMRVLPGLVQDLRDHGTLLSPIADDNDRGPDSG